MEEICPRFPVSKALSLPGMMTSAVRMAMGFLLGVDVGRDAIVVEGVQLSQPPVVSSLADRAEHGAHRAHQRVQDPRGAGRRPRLRGHAGCGPSGLSLGAGSRA